MAGGLDINKCISEHFDASQIYEFPFFCIGRQGGRTAVEILARAFIMEGKYVYLGQNLTGKRSMGTNNMILRFADTPDILVGISVTHASGVMFMHEALMWPDYASLPQAHLKRHEVVSQFTRGILMVCTSKAPDEIEYPLDFEGTVATVDAEAIFTERVGIEPAPSGITSLGLFVAANEGLIDLETLKRAILEHDRLSKRVRELNVECMQEAYEKARVAHDIKLQGKMTREAYVEISNRRPSGDLITAEERGVGTMWRSKLPICDMTKCVCIECLSAYFCPEGVLTWEDEAIKIDYDFCKGCGTCVLECPEKAMNMEDADVVMEKFANAGR